MSKRKLAGNAAVIMGGGSAVLAPGAPRTGALTSAVAASQGRASTLSLAGEHPFLVAPGAPIFFKVRRREE
jgi:hypothetical protein